MLDSAATVEDLSVLGTCRYVYERGNGVQETQSGLWDVFQRLLYDSVPQHRVHVNKAVKSVHWASGHDDAVTVSPGINNNVEEGLQKMQGLSQITSQVSGHSYRQEPNRELSEYENSSQSAERNSEEQDGDSVKMTPSKFSPSSRDFVQSDFRVAINCEDGDVLFADHVIVTSSVGFLKEHSEFFVPSLPKTHIDAIRSIGFGNVAKVFLMWDLDDKTARDASGQKSDADGVSEWRRRMLGSDVEGVVLLWPEGVQPTVKSAKSSLRTSVSR